jgi:hypothetical protein
MLKKLFFFIAAAAILLSLILTGAHAELAGYNQAAGTWQYITLGAYPTGADGAVSPIIWRILKVTDHTAYAISENILEAKQLHHTYSPYPGWLESDLFAYLNQDFIYRAFSEAEIALLAVNPDGGLVTLPDVEDIRNAAYGFSNDKSRECQSTAYADVTGLYYYHRNAYYYHPFWTRTASEVNLFAQRCTKKDGKIGYLAVTAKDLGVRPVVQIDMNLAAISGGSGTLGDPYILRAMNEEPSGYKDVMPTAQVISATELPDNIAAQPAETSAPLKSADSAVFDSRFPALTDEGFLPEGEPEFILEDAENNAWLYCSQTLRIEISRHFDESKPLRWLVADIYTKEGADVLRMFANDAEHMTTDASKYLKEPVDIAVDNNLVLAMNGDYFIYRLGRRETLKTYTIGIEIRNQVVIFDNPAKATRKQYPNLDLLALYGDGDMRVFNNDEVSSEDLLAQGALDVLSFGPYLIRDGVVNTRYLSLMIGSTLQPRTAIGMVEKGHYISMVIEGRIPQSIGATCETLGDMMKDLGCSVAFNLDGGWTSALVFMGKQLNQLGIYNGSSNARAQNEVLGIGFTSMYSNK